MNILVRVKSVYGNTTIYPANEAAQTLADLAGTKTLTPRALRLARKLGHDVQLDGDASLREALAVCGPDAISQLLVTA